MKRVWALIICAALLIAGCSCKRNGGAANADESAEAGASPPATIEESAGQEDGFVLLGLVIDDDGENQTYMTMYGFLHTAENLGYAAKLYRAGSAGLKAAIEAAVADGVDGLMVFDPGDTSAGAIDAAAKTGVKVVVPYYPTSASKVSTNIVADDSAFYDDLARGIAERMTERSLKSGRLLVYGRDTALSYAAFDASIRQSYPQFSVVQFERLAVDDAAAVAELAEFLLYNRDIKGMYVADADLAATAVKARAEAQRRFRAEGTPSPSPSSTALPGATLAPTPNSGLLTAISVTLFCNGLSDENYELFSDNDIYALCIEPYYEAAAQATMALDKLMQGDSVAPSARVNRPIVYGETAEKYKAILDEVKYMFNLGE